jgi:hypothetical protein
MLLLGWRLGPQFTIHKRPVWRARYSRFIFATLLLVGESVPLISLECV